MTHQISPLMDVTEEPTPSSVWRAVAGSAINEELLEWPPDLFALTEVLLERSEVYRFALCPPGGLKWPPDRYPFWPAVVADGGVQWSGRVEDETVGVPDLLAEEWEVFTDGSATPLADLAEARNSRMCEALLTLHAIADSSRRPGRGPAIDSLLAVTLEGPPCEEGLAGLAHEVLRYVVEERITRDARKGAHLDQTLRTNSRVEIQPSVGNTT